MGSPFFGANMWEMVEKTEKKIIITELFFFCLLSCFLRVDLEEWGGLFPPKNVGGRWKAVDRIVQFHLPQHFIILCITR